MTLTVPPLSWDQLTSLDTYSCDRVNGPTNAQANLRLFGQPESAVRVTLYRDRHAWCPYCQKVWLWLEEKQVPYRIAKVTMFCYGDKEAWYKRRVPSGMLPALELEGRLITESDDILIALEECFGPLGAAMTNAQVMPLRQLERVLFRAWCLWLCQPHRSDREDGRAQEQFAGVARRVEAALGATPGPYFLQDFSTADLVFIPYVERMNASLYYYKGYALKQVHPALADWFTALESRATYRGTQSDFHTHAHDLPPQMGGCYGNGLPQTARHQRQVDQGPWGDLPEVGYPEPDTSCLEALHRVLKHRHSLMAVNPAAPGVVDEGLRCALTHLVQGDLCQPPPGADLALRYLRDRISVPRDMSLHAARRLRTSLEATAALVSPSAPAALPTQHRRDQDPANFVAVG